MTRAVGNLAFRRELSDHADRIKALEDKPGGGDGTLLVRDGGDFNFEAESLLIGSGLEVGQTDVAEARIRSGFRLESNGEGFGFGPDEQLAGIQLGDGLTMQKDLTGENLAILEPDGLARFTPLNEFPLEYTLQESDIGKIVRVPLPGGGEGEEEVFEVTIPADADDDLPVGARIGVMVSGGFATGIIKILRGDGVVFASLHETVESTNTLGAYIYLVKVNASEWLIEDRNGFSISA